MYDEITKPIFENSKKLMRYSRNLFLKNSKKVDDRPTDIQDLRIYATSRRIKIDQHRIKQERDTL